MPGLQAIDQAMSRTAARLTPAVRNRAVEAGWPEHLAARLSMTATPEGTLSIAYDGPREEAEDIEYGTQDRAPRSVLSYFDTVKGKRLVRETTLDSMDEVHERIQGLFS